MMNYQIKENQIIDVLTTVCNSDFSLLRARFLLAIRSCINYNIMESSIADILFLSGMSLSISEQMTKGFMGEEVELTRTTIYRDALISS
jgi:hypothetical protein